jgi:hypothetical protein
MIVACQNNKQAEIFVKADEDSFSNLTDSLGSYGLTYKWKFCIVNSKNYQAFVLCTDGISSDLLPENKVAFANEVFVTYKNYDTIKRKEEIEHWLKEWPVPSHSDDKTIVCLFDSANTGEVDE